MRAAKRVIDVRGNRDLDVAKPWIKAECVDARQARERRATWFKVAAAIIQEPDAECLKHASTAVVGRGSAQPEHDVLCTGIECSGDQLANACAARAQRIAPPTRDLLKATCRCHFNDGGTVSE